MNDPLLLAKLLGRAGARRVRGALVCCAVLLGASTASATLITVTTTDDEFNNDGDCSLREATVAANTNAVVDACPAGAAASTDTIRLAGGAAYLLTVAAPGAPADDPKGGDLDILTNNGANPAVIIDTDGQNGPATIRQTVADQKVIQVQSATMELHDLVIAGGSPLDCGGGVSLQAPGSLLVDGCRFVGNSALNGGALCNLSGGTMTVSDSVFVDNSTGGLSNGGAIRNAGTLTVTGGTFVRNTPGGDGGAIRNDANVVDALQVTGSCFVDNGDDAVSNGTGAAQDATGNWWGSSSGPSSEGPGSGDSVAVDGSRQIVKLKFDGGTHDFVELTKDVVAGKDYKKVRVEALYGKPSGIARFDGVRLTLDP